MKNLLPCTYRNLAKRPQVLRINEMSLFFERTVFPNQCIVFQAQPDAVIEIHEDVTALPSDSFTCEELRALSAEDLLPLQTAEVA